MLTHFMETISHTNDWNIEQIIDALDQHGFAIIDHAYPSDYLNNLVNECTLNLNKFRQIITLQLFRQTLA